MSFSFSCSYTLCLLVLYHVYYSYTLCLLVLYHVYYSYTLCLLPTSTIQKTSSINSTSYSWKCTCMLYL
ncbi:hypothetical protein EB796_006647 [Bugula neritina]|uniref:Uncharacterized protein n=1 Tax=Bugula neritina TaxID=10212 RepID=A0A7J7KB38_BUGNE|nr:hypothetical protein EB796_006647 [Bugula neritina]